MAKTTANYTYLTHVILQTRPAKLIISCGQHFLASNCTTRVHAAVQIAAATA